MNQAIEFDGDSDFVQLPEPLSNGLRDDSGQGNHGTLVDCRWYGRTLDPKEVRQIYEDGR